SEALFKRHFGYTPYCKTKAPGVVELLGSFAGIVDGLALTIAIEKSLTISASPRLDGKVEIISSSFPNDVQRFWITENFTAQNLNWQDFIKSLIYQLHRHSAGVGGFNASIHSEVPIKVGFESSASLLCAMALTIRKLYPFRLTETGTMLYPPRRDRYGKVEPPNKKEKMSIAVLCKNSELTLAGEKADIIPELTSLFAKKYYAMCVDCRFNSYEYVPIFGEIAIVAFVIEELANSSLDYIADLRKLAIETSMALLTKSLRSVDLQYLKSCGKKLTQRQFNFAYHVASEIQRVIYAGKALEDGDFEQFGQYMIMSYESTKELIGFFPKELDLLVKLCLNQNGCYGSRAIVSRTPSTVISIVSADEYENFIKTVPKQFYEKTKLSVKTLICVPSDGAE
ncbi:MAG: galactokinase, partial [Limisphaerales bacterium]